MKEICVDMDNTLYDFSNPFKNNLIEKPHIQYPQSAPGFFRDLPLIPGALEAIIRLENSKHYNVCILTAPSVKNPLCYTEKREAIGRDFGIAMAGKLNICPDKSRFIGDYLIDDCDSGKGQDKFKGELIHFGSKQFPSWQHVLRYLNP